MIIKYGILNNNIDVTNICFSELRNNNIITIPSSENTRAHFFTDPLKGVLKKIFIFLDEKIMEFDYFYTIKIDLSDNIITTINDRDINQKLKNIHSKLKIKFGDFQKELPEQKIAVRYLKGNENVLEIGGNIGRNSLIISHILHNNNFVTMECDKNIANQLLINRDLNNFKFHIENCALSKKKLIQKGWNTKQSNILLPGYKWVSTTTYENIKNKYNINFDTLILDCEGAFYYILQDMPEILDNINLILVENDYTNILHKKYVDDVLIKNNFYRDYVESGHNNVSQKHPCKKNFYEVWKRNI